MARTNTELYRRYEGELRPNALRFLPLFLAGVRTATKKKIPLLVLYAVPTIATIVYSFVVYAKYAAEDMAVSIGGIEGMMSMFAQRAMVNLEVKGQIVELNHVMRLFSLLAVTWFGSGLFAEDRRLGAHLLYFSRPITRLDYFLGKFLTVSFFGALSVMVPGLVVCLIASWTSPDWSFLKEEGDTILRTILYSGIWITLTSSIVLCVSSLASRKTFALVGAFGFFVLNFGLGGVLSLVDRRYLAISVMMDMRKLRNWIFEIDDDWRDLVFSEAVAVSVIGGVIMVCLLIIAARLRKLEVVA
ncbi:MAG: ABC transporter permease subunit [Planctomycetota bacterium]